MKERTRERERKRELSTVITRDRFPVHHPHHVISRRRFLIARLQTDIRSPEGSRRTLADRRAFIARCNEPIFRLKEVACSEREEEKEKRC